MSTDVVVAGNVTRDDVLALQAAMLSMAPAVLPEPVHFHAEGLYARMIVMPAGHVFTGKEHARSHMFIMLDGEMEVTLPDGFVHHMTGHHVFVSPAYRKSAFHVIRETTLLTVHHTQYTDLDDIEADLIVPEQGILPGNGGAA